MSLQTTTRLKVSYPFSCAEIPNSEACWLEGSTDNFFFLNPKNSETQRFSSPVPMENCWLKGAGGRAGSLGMGTIVRGARGWNGSVCGSATFSLLRGKKKIKDDLKLTMYKRSWKLALSCQSDNVYSPWSQTSLESWLWEDFFWAEKSGGTRKSFLTSINFLSSKVAAYVIVEIAMESAGVFGSIIDTGGRILIVLPGILV